MTDQETLEPGTAPEMNAPFIRMWHVFLNGRVLIAAVLVLIQMLETRWQPVGNPMVWIVSFSYLGLTLLLRLTAGELPPEPKVGARWILIVGVDLVAVSLLQLFQLGSINYTPLLAIPILVASVFGSLTVAMATTAGITLLTLAWVSWLVALHAVDATQSYYQASFACAGYFVVSYLTHELARRVRRENVLVRHSRFRAQTQQQVNELVIRHLEDGVLVVDWEYRVQQANPAALRLLDLRLEQPLPFALALHPGWKPLYDAVARTFAQAQPLTLNIPTRGFDQNQTIGLHMRTWLTRANDTAAEQSNSSARQLCVVFLHDLREMEAKLRTEKLASMGRMSAAVAHEIRNPLAAISQANALLQEDLGDQASAQQMCRIVGQNAERLARIVDDVLDIARVQQSTAPINSSSLVLDEQVAQICHEWQTLSGHGSRMLELHLATIDQSVIFESEHLRRVLVNLLDNAQRYRSSVVDADALQVITNAPSPDRIWLQVWSDGRPLEASVQRHLFEPFFSSQSRSSGLGLYICRELCQRYDAHISYQRLSRPTARGLTPGNAFSVEFRVAQSAERPPSLFDSTVF